MVKSIVKSGKSIDDAIDIGLSELDLEREFVDIEVIEEPVKRFFGLLGTTDAKVKLTVIRQPIDIAKEISQEFLRDIFEKMKIAANFNIQSKKNNLYINIVDINGDDKGIVIGKRGNTLDSIQYLLSLAVNKKTEKYIRIYLNIGNYREKREDTLKSLARNMADKSKATGRPVKLEPMNPYERRLIHSALQKRKDIKTYSEGKDPYRRIVIESK